MVKKIISKLQRFFTNRIILLLIVFLTMSLILVARIFKLQIVDGRTYADNFTVMTSRKRMVAGTRGNIYDVKGKLLAYNELANTVTIEDNGSYNTTREKNLALNGEIYELTTLITGKGDMLSHNFHIVVDEDNNYVFDVDEGVSRDRFRADIFGYQRADEMTEAEANATAEDIMHYLAAERFMLVNEENPYTAEELEKNGLPQELTKEETLHIIIVRYQLSLISYQRYVPVTVAEDVSDETVAAIEERSDHLQGVSISEDYKRVYNDPMAFAPIIGYTGKPSAEELAELEKQNEQYTSNSIIGKAGIEQYMETTLQGTEGSEDITVDNLGKVLSIDENSRVQPVQGNDVYLTIDSELQNACYQILEQRIAGILLLRLQNTKYGPEEVEDADNELYIPIYDVYYALINNNVIDITHFSEEDASTTEKAVYERYQQKQDQILKWITEELGGGEMPAYKDLTDEYKDYLDYICNRYLIQDTGILNSDKMDESDDMYQAYFKDENVSFIDFLHYAAKQDWIDISKLANDSSYMDSEEIYQAVIDHLVLHLVDRTAFARIIYHYMILDDQVDPSDLCKILYDQGILNKHDDLYSALQSGDVTSYDFMAEKIRSLEITPAMLALDPCSGSIVINDPETGEVRALVTYPGYDNNRLANEMDTDYYNKLYNDLSTPFYNKATQQLTAPGSTYKPVMAAAGLNEGVINMDTEIECTGLFGVDILDESDQLHCWYRDGHGSLDVIGGIQHSCNVFFCTIGYRLGLDSEENFSQNTSLAAIQKYSAMFALDQKTDIQITESSPHVTDDLAIPSAIGQGAHQYTTSQLSRYAATIANNGVSYDLNLLSKVTDPDGNLLKEFTPTVAKKTELPDYIWDAIHTGMHEAMQENETMMLLPFDVYGKTGTAQEANNRPSHSLIIGSSEYNGDPIAFAIRIAYGYSSQNSCLVASDVLQYYYNTEDEGQILTGNAEEGGVSNVAVTD